MSLYNETMGLVGDLATTMRREAEALAAGTPAAAMRSLAAEKARLADRLTAATRAVRDAGSLDGDPAALADALRMLADVADASARQLEHRRRAVEDLLGTIARASEPANPYGRGGVVPFRRPGSLVINSRV